MDRQPVVTSIKNEGVASSAPVDKVVACPRIDRVGDRLTGADVEAEDYVVAVGRQLIEDDLPHFVGRQRQALIDEGDGGEAVAKPVAGQAVQKVDAALLAGIAVVEQDADRLVARYPLTELDLTARRRIARDRVQRQREAVDFQRVGGVDVAVVADGVEPVSGPVNVGVVVAGSDKRVVARAAFDHLPPDHRVGCEDNVVASGAVLIEQQLPDVLHRQRLVGEDEGFDLKGVGPVQRPFKKNAVAAAKINQKVRSARDRADGRIGQGAPDKLRGIRPTAVIAHDVGAVPDFENIGVASGQARKRVRPGATIYHIIGRGHAQQGAAVGGAFSGENERAQIRRRQHRAVVQFDLSDLTVLIAVFDPLPDQDAFDERPFLPDRGNQQVGQSARISAEAELIECVAAQKQRVGVVAGIVENDVEPVASRIAIYVRFIPALKIVVARPAFDEVGKSVADQLIVLGVAGDETVGGGDGQRAGGGPVSGVGHCDRRFEQPVGFVCGNAGNLACGAVDCDAGGKARSFEEERPGARQVEQRGRVETVGGGLVRLRRLKADGWNGAEEFGAVGRFESQLDRHVATERVFDQHIDGFGPDNARRDIAVGPVRIQREVARQTCRQQREGQRVAVRVGGGDRPVKGFRHRNLERAVLRLRRLIRAFDGDRRRRRRRRGAGKAQRIAEGDFRRLAHGQLNEIAERIEGERPVTIERQFARLRPGVQRECRAKRDVVVA